jgi:hypothetical protein
MRMLASVSAALLSLASISPAWAEPLAYGVAFDELYRVDLGTRKATLIGRTGSSGGTPLALLSGLTYGPGNELYAVAGTQKALVRIDTNSGSASLVGRFALAGQGEGQFDALDLSLTYDCAGHFWMTSAIKRDLWKVDPGNGTLTFVGNTGRQITGLAMRNGKLYGTGVGSDLGLFSIDTTNGAASPIGRINGSIPWIEPSFGYEGTLWATLNYNPPFNRDWSDLATIDPSTGALTNLGQITGPESLRGISMKGLAVAPTACLPPPDDGNGGPADGPATLPVSSPWMLLSTALLLLGLGLRRLRRQAL